MTTALLSYETLGCSDPDLQAYRSELFRTDKPGYILIKNFVSPEMAEHLAGYWNDTPPSPRYFLEKTTEIKTVGQKPFAFFGNHRTCYHNYLWNRPLDELSHNICYSVTLLRNQLEQQPLHRHLLPHWPLMASYRIVNTRSVEGTEVLPHTDWDEPENDGLRYNHEMTQATLFLSRYGVDYEGDGFTFTTNTGEKVRFGPDIKVEPGDLIIWRYKNEHMVGANHALPNGRGFSRMLFPYEKIALPKANPEVSLSTKAKTRLEKIFRGLLKKGKKGKYAQVNPSK